MNKYLIIPIFTSSLFAINLAYAEQPEDTNDSSTTLEHVSIIGKKTDDQATIPGAAHVIDNFTLTRDEHDDIQRILAEVPGVYIRGEDGFGLRPNIGLRGTTTERSQKITLLEDGILIAPAPYSAPAAYYFPMVSRMSAIEVVKGPSAITQGPNTVGGAINLATRDVPYDRFTALDVALGSNAYRKLHGQHGDANDTFAWLVDAMLTGTDGFKTLPNDEDTGFDKKNLMLKTRWNSDSSIDSYHQIDLKLNYATETSNETYLGLTDADFDIDPNQRYAASQNDRMEWTHRQLSISYLFEPSDHLSINTQYYLHDFERAWTKLNRLDNNDSLSNTLSAPTAGNNQRYMQVITGEKDSEFNDETLLIGTNAREYLSTGLQSTLNYTKQTDTLTHNILAGVRVHHDEIQRNHTEQAFLMQNESLVDAGDPVASLLVNDEHANALALFIKDDMSFNHYTATLGVRYETIRYESDNETTDTSVSNRNNFLAPGAGLFYQATDSLGLFAGIHKGFVPTGPGESDDLEPEESVNFEIGARYNQYDFSVEAVGFYNDYSNLVGRCTFSSSCIGATGEAFNAGAATIAGIELVTRKELLFSNGIALPLSLTYTYTQAEFEENFDSSFPLWGNVTAGDEIPYMPSHMLNLSISVESEQWDITTNINYTGEQAEQAGTAAALDDVTLDAFTVVDITGNYYLNNQHGFYARIDNIFDNEHIVSRRPFGARPGKPLTATVGYKLNF